MKAYRRVLILIALAVVSICYGTGIRAEDSRITQGWYATLLDELKPLGQGRHILGDTESAVLQSLGTVSCDGAAKFSRVRVEDAGEPSLDKAILIDSGAAKFYWSTQVPFKNKEAVSKGDIIYFTAILRSRIGGAVGKPVLEVSGANGLLKGDWDMSVSNDWTRVHSWFLADTDYAKGKLSFCLHFGEIRQIVQLAGVAAIDMGPNIDPLKLPKRKLNLTYPGMEAAAQWRKDALDRIERIRKGDLRITAVDAKGKPLSGAQVKVDMVRHSFFWGTSLPLGMIPDSKVKPWNADFARTAGASEEDKARMRKELVRLFNGINRGPTWAYDYGEDARYTGEDLLSELDFYRGKGLRVRGGCLVYPRPEFAPSYARELLTPAGAKEFKASLMAWIKDGMHDYSPYSESMHVTNELDCSPYFTDILGGDPMDRVAEWYVAAKAAAPRVQLTINEAGPTETYYNRIKELLNRKAPLEGIGMQLHCTIGAPGPEARLKDFDRFAAFGLPLEVTEYEMVIKDGREAEQRKYQADYTRDFLIACFSHPAVTGVTLQDFWQEGAWQYDGYSCFFNKDWSLNPHGQAYIDLVLGKWWTRGTGKTDTMGQYALRGFLGDYDISVKAGGKTVKARITLPKEGREVRITVK